MSKLKIDSPFHLAVGIAALVIACSVACYLLVLMPKWHQEQVNYQSQKDAAAAHKTRMDDYNACVARESDPATATLGRLLSPQVKCDAYLK